VKHHLANDDGSPACGATSPNELPVYDAATFQRTMIESRHELARMFTCGACWRIHARMKAKGAAC